MKTYAEKQAALVARAAARCEMGDTVVVDGGFCSRKKAVRLEFPVNPANHPVGSALANGERPQVELCRSCAARALAAGWRFK